MLFLKKLGLLFLIAMGMSCGSDSTKSTGIYGSTVLQGSGRCASPRRPFGFGG
jgi:hypothetical protein